MTVHGFGKITPIQGDILFLAGYRLTRGMPINERTEKEKRTDVRNGLANLRRKTGRDFGYDIGAWHEYLQSCEEDLGYKHPYGWSRIKRKVEEAISDPEAAKYLSSMEQEDKELEIKRRMKRERKMKRKKKGAQAIPTPSHPMQKLDPTEGE